MVCRHFDTLPTLDCETYADFLYPVTGILLSGHCSLSIYLDTCNTAYYWR